MNDYNLSKANRLLFLFGVAKIPLIRFVRPRIIEFTSEHIIIKIPLRRRNKNHLKSMYFGAFAIGADLAAGFLAFWLFQERKLKASFAFKSFKSEFLRRAMYDVYFECHAGNIILNAVEQAQKNGERINEMVKVDAFCYENGEKVKVAEMEIEASIKVKS
ncbi:MAG: YiiD C-terminal domain-containing protein [Bacteroidia bacterium]